MFSLIPAAGHSTRMGRPKLALPLGDRTVLEHVLAALSKAGARPLVILGPHVADLADSARSAGAMVLQLPDATPHMRETVERGLEYLEAQFHPPPDEPWLLVPADHPTLDPDLVRMLAEEIARRRDCSICVPAFQGQRGHPALIRWRHWPAIRDYPHDRGLNRYLREHQAETLVVPVDSADVLLDLDTPEDYERIRRQVETEHSGWASPTTQ